MTDKKKPAPHRSILVGVEVPGTPEEVWEAIATGPGISSWFVPTEVDEHTGGEIRWQLDPDTRATGEVKAWEPPRRLVIEERDWGPGAPPLGTEWSVEPLAGGRCVVRVVHSLFGEGGDWEDQWESIASNWPPIFSVLRSYLDRFRGQQASIIRVSCPSDASLTDSWRTLSEALGVAGVEPGLRWSMPRKNAPASLTGVGEPPPDGKQPAATVLLDEPLPGILSATVFEVGPQVVATVGLYFYGPDAAELAAADQEHWDAWLKALFS